VFAQAAQPVFIPLNLLLNYAKEQHYLAGLKVRSKTDTFLCTNGENMIITSLSSLDKETAKQMILKAEEL